MKTVFILGAGSSREAGGPLMHDFLDIAWTLYRRHAPGIAEANDAFADVFDAISELRMVHDKSYLELDNIEVLFGAIEMAQVTGTFAQRNSENIKMLRRSIITLIVRTLEQRIQFPVRDGHVWPPEQHDKFVKMLLNIRRATDHPDLAEFAFITFNYDLALDVALSINGFGYDYCLSETQPGSKSPYLKLHGSINWGTCEECNAVIPYDVADARFNLFPDHEYVRYNLGSSLSTRKHHDKPLRDTPVLVPPTWNKTEYQSQLTNVWKRAARELALAENIFVIGYSLPESDLFFRYLFALGSESATRIRKFLVFDPDRTGKVEARFRQLIGRGIENRFRYYPWTFTEAVGAIHYTLQSPSQML